MLHKLCGPAALVTILGLSMEEDKIFSLVLAVEAHLVHRTYDFQ